MKETTAMDKITEEMMEHVCDKICRFPWKISDQEEMDAICDSCEMGKHVCNILNEYNQLNVLVATEQENHRWIPVAERLPEVRERVLVTGQYGDVHTAYWDAEGWHLAINGLVYAHRPLAWMPLPELYEPVD